MSFLAAIRSLTLISSLPVYFAVATAGGQSVPTVDYSSQTPVFGVGHSYYQSPVETLNPANGSVSIRLSVPLPAGRGITPSFGLIYDTAGQMQLTPNYSSNTKFASLSIGTDSWLPANSDHPLRTGSGWSQATPQLTLSRQSMSYPDGTATCFYTSGYVFTDRAGQRHAFDFTLVDDYSGIESTAEVRCNIDGYGLVHQVVSTDRTVQMNVTGLGLIYITEQDGTVYGFYYPTTMGINVITAQTIEDRNGNVISGSSSNVFSGASFVDTLGRKLVSQGVTDIDVGDGRHYSVMSGGGLTDGTAQLPMQIVLQDSWDNSYCSSSSSLTKTYIGGGVTRFTLPDGTYYSFEYESKYGLISKITYPNGGFVSYEWGLPGGMSDSGYIQWEYVFPWFGGEGWSNTQVNHCGVRYAVPVVKHRYVSFDGSTIALQQDLSYTTTFAADDLGPFPFGGASWISKTTTVVDQDLVAGTSRTVIHNYVPATDGSSPTLQPGLVQNLYSKLSDAPALESSVDVKDSSGSILKEVKTIWLDSGRPLTVQTLPGSGEVTEIDYKYTLESGMLPQLAETDIYDYGSGAHGPLLKKTVTDYQSFGPAPNFPVNQPPNGDARSLLSFPSAVKVYDLSGLVAETDFTYDQGSLALASVISHDDANYGPGSSPPRGNATTITRRCFPNCADAVTTIQYDTTGQPVSMKDANGQSTGATYTFQYADQFASGTGSPQGPTNAFRTRITSPPVNGITIATSATYSFLDGTIQSITDANGKNTLYCYATGGCGGGTKDPWGRVTQIQKPDGGGAYAVYGDTGPNPTQLTKTLRMPSSTMDSTITLDGLGHPVRTEMPTTNGTVYVDKQYNGQGQLHSETNPYVSTLEPTYGVKLMYYDALGRLARSLNPDGTFETWDYVGNTTIHTDAAANKWSLTEDALGRLVHVQEPTGSLTDYTYTARGDLSGAIQHGVGEGTRTRSFIYNSLSRLILSTNPETGTICYGTVPAGQVPSPNNCTGGYDANGNLQFKTDARGVETHYTYDALNRLTGKTYNDGTLGITYDYDSYGDWDGLPLTNLVGRLAHVAVGAGTASWDEKIFSYDPVGRTVQVEDASPSEAGTTNHVTTAKYDLAGHMTDLWYPRLTPTPGPHLQQSWDPAGRLSKVYTMDGGIETDYWMANSYFPDGTLHSVQYGNGVNQQRSENNRLQTCELSVFLPPAIGGTMVMDQQYFFSQSATTRCAPTPGNNGNIWQILDNTNPTLGSNNHNQTFGYDALNRLSSWSTQSMAGSPRGQTYLYDSFGNGVQAAGSNMPNFPLAYTGATSAWPYDGGNHMLSNYFNCGPANATGINPANPGYDLAGNVLCQGAQGIDAQAYLYDAESRISKLLSQSMNNTYAVSATYTYDAEGNRVRKDLAPFGNQAFTEYSYFNGQPLSEKDQNGNWTDYIYAGGQKIARVTSSYQRLHLSGTGCGANSWVTWNLVANNIPIGAGDHMQWLEEHADSQQSYLEIQFADNTWILEGAMDPQSGLWQTATVDLSNWAGETLWGAWIAELADGVGNVDAKLRDLALVKADGTVIPFFNGQNYVPGSVALSCPNGTVVSENVQVEAGAGPVVGTHFYAGDHLGTTQMEFSSGGWPVWKGSFAPFGQEILPGTATDFVGPMPADGTAMHYKFTGKERDSESGLDYFGARYYGSSMGRFMSPDWSAKVAPVPYAKLDNPQSLNLYAYVGNNPLSRVDPDGHVTCSGSKDQCAQIKTGLDLAKAAQAKLGADSAGGKAIGKVLAFYGAWGKDNGVHVSFANLDKGTLGDEKAGPNGTTNIRFDLKQINAAAANSSSGGVFGMSERAGVEIHEGTHGVDDKVRGGGTDSRRALDATEHNAYRTESYVFQGLGVNSAQGLWSTNWTPDNMEANRSSAVDAAAAGSVAADCKGGGCKP